ncbi:hypothetical protein HN51_012785 [Arachis hypogaea]
MRARAREQRVRGVTTATLLQPPPSPSWRRESGGERERRFTDEMEREDEDAMQERRRLFRHALSSLLGSIEAAATARACHALSSLLASTITSCVSSVPFSIPRVRMQFSPLKSSAAISPDLFFRSYMINVNEEH